MVVEYRKERPMKHIGIIIQDFLFEKRKSQQKGEKTDETT